MAERNETPLQSDWTQVEESPVNKVKWSKYRQQLRDIGSQEGFPFNVVWPTLPV